MKLTKKLFLSSITALLFTNNVIANTPLARPVDVHANIQAHLQTAMSDISQPDTKSEIAKELDKTEIELEAAMLVAQASESLPENRFKVVIAE